MHFEQNLCLVFEVKNLNFMFKSTKHKVVKLILPEIHTVMIRGEAEEVSSRKMRQSKSVRVNTDAFID